MHDVEATVTRIVDGDTFVCTVHGHVLDFYFDWPNQYVRVVGYDSPELKGETLAEGLEAKNYLERLILNKTVKLRSEGKRSFHRLLAEVYLDYGENLSEVMIRSGMGVPYE